MEEIIRNNIEKHKKLVTHLKKMHLKCLLK